MSAEPPASAIAVRPLSARERVGLWRLRLRTREAVSRSLVAVPALYLLAAIALGVALPAIDRARGGGHLLGIDASAAQSVLEAIASGMIAFAGLVVSVAVLVVQFGAGQYSPRLVQIFRRDPVIKNALGLLVAPGVYALVAVADVGGSEHDRPETLTVIAGLLLMVAALAALFRFIGRLLDLMRPRRIYARLLREARHGLQDVYPFLLDESVERRPLPEDPVRATLLHEHRDEVLAAVDRARLVAAARAAGVVVEVCLPIGAHVAYGAPLLRVRGAAGAGAPAGGASGALDEQALRSALVFADGRALVQDPAFAIRCIVDVAIRALSPAVNDPTSGVEGLDALDGLLRRIGQRRLAGSAVVDDEGAIRLVLLTPGWDDLIDLTLTEIRRYGADNPQISRRLRALLDGLAESVDAERGVAVARHRALLEADLDRLYPNPVERAFAATPDRLGIGGHGGD